MNRIVTAGAALMVAAMLAVAPRLDAQEPVIVEAPPAELVVTAPVAPEVAVDIVETDLLVEEDANVAQQRMGKGRYVALMAVGGAALVTGAILGGSAGSLIAVGGAVVGLWGLYNYVR